MPILNNWSQRFRFNTDTSSHRLNVICLLLLALAFAGCRDAETSKLVGRWELAAVEDIADQVGDAAESDNDPKMVLEFQAGGTLRTKTNINTIHTEKTGTWFSIGYDQTSKVLEVECKIGQQTSRHPITFVSEDVIRLVPPNMAGLNEQYQFKRAK
ncbi:MAG: hypothetical protein R3C03_22470 [Pirellulaceae bacterium]